MNEGIKHIFTSLRINLGLLGKNQRLSKSMDYLEGFIEMQSDELEALHSAHDDLKKEKLIVVNELAALNKSQYKMQGKNQKQGAKVMRLEKDLRSTDSDKWNKYKEEVKNVQL